MAQWNFDTAHSNIDFVVRHMMVTNVRGSFDRFDGTFEYDPANPENTFLRVSIDAASINTGVDDRDTHLRSPDFFDTARYPYLTFESTQVEMINDTRAKVTGDLTIRGVTRPVTLDVAYLGEVISPYGDTRAGFEVTGQINREDFGLTWNQALETGGVLVGKDVKLQLAVQVVRVAEAQAV